jgi:hypothetical protein
VSFEAGPLFFKLSLKYAVTAKSAKDNSINTIQFHCRKFVSEIALYFQFSRSLVPRWFEICEQC